MTRYLLDTNVVVRLLLGDRDSTRPGPRNSSATQATNHC
ncbi:hypothetical protein SAMN06296429_105154 [Janibacter indicus]|uniref:Uncharacterized protein n=1 Tax=Janibacter indicus TaxID=857417 RepID=A0A1W2A972_9MICO|nr:hypothetical protein SAMN06296429_105154 [Janibacter indicus]